MLLVQSVWSFTGQAGDELKANFCALRFLPSFDSTLFTVQGRLSPTSCVTRETLIQTESW